MENYQDYNVLDSSLRAGENSIAKTFVSNVFSWMAGALAITAVVAYWFGTDMSYMSLLRNENGTTGLGMMVTFAPLAFILVMSFGLNKLSYTAIMACFLGFSFVMGMSLSFIFLRYTSSSIYLTFAISAGMFGIMALVGYTTHTDLTKFGSLMIMAVVGLFIAMIVNIFLHSSGMDYLISFIGVLVFTGLTAYDVQKLKRIGAGIELGNEGTSKLIIMGALTLYLDFINLFLFLLRFFGGNRK